MNATMIQVEESKCTGCNACVRVCPTNEANYVTVHDNGRITVGIHEERCIHCGECVRECPHHARFYVDDTAQFMKELQGGTPLTVIVAPAVRTAFGEQWASLLQWVRQQGRVRIYDVGLGADICTWAHTRLLKEGKARHLISQPCAAVTSYILKYHPGLVPHLSPVQSPMLCLVIYLKKQLGIEGKIAALSPCIAKKQEFIDTGLVDYNVTFQQLKQYLEENHVRLSTDKGFQFDGFPGQDGSYYPLPGGLKENLKLWDNRLYIMNSEGVPKVYQELMQYEKQKESDLPDVFDVLSCEYGCNSGPVVGVVPNLFYTGRVMEGVKQQNLSMNARRKRMKQFDRLLRVDDFCRT